MPDLTAIGGDLSVAGGGSMPDLTLVKSGNAQSYAKSPSFSAYSGMWGIYVPSNESMAYSCEMRVKPAVFPKSTIFKWSVTPDPDYAGINGYLHVDWGNYSNSPGTITPRQVYTITDLTLNVDWSFAGDDATGLLSECWLTTASHGSGGWSDALFEIGFLPKVSPSAQTWASGLPNVGSGSFVDGLGVTWVVKNAGGSPQYVVAYRSGYGDHHGALPFADLFAFLINAGVLTGNEWFNGVAFGPEPLSGAASLTINDFPTPTYSGAARVPWTLSTLTASALSSTSIKLDWKAAGGATSHEYRINGGAWTATSSSTTQTVTGLTQGTAYNFEVRGVNSTGNGAASNTASATTFVVYDVPAGANVLNRWKAADLVGANASAVSTWAPRTGSANFVQATGAQQPTLRTNVLNGKSVVRFDGTDDGMSATIGASDTQPFTVYVLFNAAFVSNVAREILSATQFELYLNALTTTTGTRACWSNAEKLFGTYTQGTWELWSVVANGGSSAFYVNGTLITGSGSVGNGFFGTTLWLGRHATSGKNLNGDIAEVIHCDAAHDATQRSGVHTYFSNEYGLTIA